MIFIIVSWIFTVIVLSAEDFELFGDIYGKVNAGPFLWVTFFLQEFEWYLCLQKIEVKPYWPEKATWFNYSFTFILFLLCMLVLNVTGGAGYPKFVYLCSAALYYLCVPFFFAAAVTMWRIHQNFKKALKTEDAAKKSFAEKLGYVAWRTVCVIVIGIISNNCFIIFSSQQSLKYILRVLLFQILGILLVSFLLAAICLWLEKEIFCKRFLSFFLHEWFKLLVLSSVIALGVALIRSCIVNFHESPLFLPGNIMVYLPFSIIIISGIGIKVIKINRIKKEN